MPHELRPSRRWRAAAICALCAVGVFAVSAPAWAAPTSRPAQSQEPPASGDATATETPTDTVPVDATDGTAATDETPMVISPAPDAPTKDKKAAAKKAAAKKAAAKKAAAKKAAAKKAAAKKAAKQQSDTMTDTMTDATQVEAPTSAPQADAVTEPAPEAAPETASEVAETTATTVAEPDTMKKDAAKSDAAAKKAAKKAAQQEAAKKAAEKKAAKKAEKQAAKKAAKLVPPKKDTAQKVVIPRVRLPETFPKGIPLPKGIKLVSVIAPEGGYTLGYEARDQFAEVSKAYPAALKDAGYTSTTTGKQSAKNYQRSYRGKQWDVIVQGYNDNKAAPITITIVALPTDG